MKQLQDTDLMPFGKYKDYPMVTVPAPYLHWLWINGMREDTTSEVGNYIHRNFDALRLEHRDGIWEAR